MAVLARSDHEFPLRLSRSHTYPCVCIVNDMILTPAARTSKKCRLSVTRILLQLVRFNVRSLEQLSIIEKRPVPTGRKGRSKPQDNTSLTAHLRTSYFKHLKLWTTS